jgi:hypothetical protein
MIPISHRAVLQTGPIRQKGFVQTPGNTRARRRKTAGRHCDDRHRFVRDTLREVGIEPVSLWKGLRFGWRSCGRCCRDDQASKSWRKKLKKERKTKTEV